jgi:hypothetical protein
MKCMERKKLGVYFWLTPQAKELIVAIAEHLGLTQAAVIEVAVRDLAEKRGITLRRPVAREQGSTERKRRSGD